PYAVPGASATVSSTPCRWRGTTRSVMRSGGSPRSPGRSSGYAPSPSRDCPDAAPEAGFRLRDRDTLWPSDGDALGAIRSPQGARLVPETCNRRPHVGQPGRHRAMPRVLAAVAAVAEIEQAFAPAGAGVRVRPSRSGWTQNDANGDHGGKL